MNKLKGKFGASTKPSPIDEKSSETSDTIGNFRTAVIRNMIAQEQVEGLIHPVTYEQKIQSRFIDRHVQLKSGKTEADYSLEDLAFALSMYRNCGHLPPLWTSFLVVPSKPVMASLLMQLISSNPGFDDVCFEVIKAEAKQLKDDDKLCMLLFDEIVICPTLCRKEGQYSILGFEDFGYRRGGDIATHAQVFMLTNLKRKWTHPVFYSFSHGPIKPADIIKILELILGRCSSTTLKIISIICKHKPNNIEAIKTLLRTTKEARIRTGIDDRADSTIDFDGQEIVPLYDVKQLFTGIRNNFLSSNIHFVDQNVEKIAKWEHIKEMYEMPGIKLSQKLTDKHIYPDKINKNDVLTSLQVFSQRVATNILIPAKMAALQKRPPPDSLQTSHLLFFLDQLYDSLNGCDSEPDESKPLRSTATAKSPHLQFWEDAVVKLETFKFKKQGASFKSSALKCLILTTKNFIYLFKKLQDQNMNAFNQQKLSLEKLEKFMNNVTNKRISTVERFQRHYHFNKIRSFLGGNPVSKRYNNSNQNNSEVFEILQKILLSQLNEDLKVEKFSKIPALELFGIQDYPLDRKLISVLRYFISKTCTDQCKKVIYERSFKMIKDPKDNRSIKTLLVNLQFSDQIRNACTLIKFMLGKDLHKRRVLNHVMNYVSNEIQFTYCEHSEKITKLIVNHLIKINTEKYIDQINEVLKGKYFKHWPSNSSTYLKKADKLGKKSR
ncbi:uncharacterized protein LOC126733910 [Anthonomus grandis grandis]|uniref:uncharacterized protein LOC126733910 n=1 Tax=Anthonomus grandis grandis TaxID=2921223 RepID=UPI0021667F19|nr:uncharacterized protein LOC126733910 [Anthonomus grandis grandis]